MQKQLYCSIHCKMALCSELGQREEKLDTLFRKRHCKRKCKSLDDLFSASDTLNINGMNNKSNINSEINNCNNSILEEREIDYLSVNGINGCCSVSIDKNACGIKTTALKRSRSQSSVFNYVNIHVNDNYYTKEEDVCVKNEKHILNEDNDDNESIKNKSKQARLINGNIVEKSNSEERNKLNSNNNINTSLLNKTEGLAVLNAASCVNTLQAAEKDTIKPIIKASNLTNNSKGLNPIINNKLHIGAVCGSINKVAGSPVLRDRRKPLKAIHGICAESQLKTEENLKNSDKKIIKTSSEDSGLPEGINIKKTLHTYSVNIKDNQQYQSDGYHPINSTAGVQLKGQTSDGEGINLIDGVIFGNLVKDDKKCIPGVVSIATKDSDTNSEVSINSRKENDNVKNGHVGGCSDDIKEIKVENNCEFNSFLLSAFGSSNGTSINYNNNCERDLNLENPPIEVSSPPSTETHADDKRSIVQNKGSKGYTTGKPLNVNRKTSLHTRLKAFFNSNSGGSCTRNSNNNIANNKDIPERGRKEGTNLNTPPLVIGRGTTSTEVNNSINTTTVSNIVKLGHNSTAFITATNEVNACLLGTSNLLSGHSYDNNKTDTYTINNEKQICSSIELSPTGYCHDNNANKNCVEENKFCFLNFQTKDRNCSETVLDSEKTDNYVVSAVVIGKYVDEGKISEISSTCKVLNTSVDDIINDNIERSGDIVQEKNIIDVKIGVNDNNIALNKGLIPEKEHAVGIISGNLITSLTSKPNITYLRKNIGENRNDNVKSSGIPVDKSVNESGGKEVPVCYSKDQDISLNKSESVIIENTDHINNTITEDNIVVDVNTCQSGIKIANNKDNILSLENGYCTDESQQSENHHTEVNNLTLSEKDTQQQQKNDEFISSQKKKIALYRGKYSVNLDHHSKVSSNLSLASSLASSKGSSKGSSKKLNIRNVEQILTMNTRPRTRVGKMNFSNETSIQDSGNIVKEKHSRMNPPMALNPRLETSYTSQDSGYVPGLAGFKRGLSHSQPNSELSSRYSDSSTMSNAHRESMRLHGYAPQLQSQRPGGSGKSDTTSYSFDQIPLKTAIGDHNTGKTVRSKSYTDINRRSTKGSSKRQRKRELLMNMENGNSRSKSQHEICFHESMDNLGNQGKGYKHVHDSDLESNRSSLYLMGSRPMSANIDSSSTPVLEMCDKLHHSVSAYAGIDGIQQPVVLNQNLVACSGQANTNQNKSREWGTVGNIPTSVKRDRKKERDNILRTMSCDNGYSDMHRASRRSYEMIDRIESESEDSDSSIDIENMDDFSMADDASHLGGCSLDDKLRLAASKGQVERIPTLLAQGAGFQPDKEGRTAIHYAALSGYSEGVRILGANGCNINTQDNLGYTALHRAAAQGHVEVVRVLCESQCNLNVQDDVHGNTALHEAAWNGYSKTVDLLCRSKALVHLVNKAGFSALHLAAQNGHNQSARSLLYAGCDSNHKNNYGDTPLHTAGRYGHAGVTRILLSAKCRISEQNKNGDSALHIASALKRKKIAKLLVEANINISLKNKQNEGAADVARRKEYPEITLIITSQPKLYKQKKKEDKKKKKEGKASGIEESDDPRKDKKMTFFFKKRSKSKDNKENKENREASTDRLESRHPTNTPSIEVQAGQTGSIHSHSSEGRLGDLQKAAARTNSKERLVSKSQVMNTNTGGQLTGQNNNTTMSKVNGLLTNYEAKTGVQYYRDLAGNVKQGPIGFAPVCNCAPAFKKIEKRLEADRNNLYDHIDATHKMISHKMEDMDHKCTHRVESADRATRNYVDENQQVQQSRINARVLQERQETDRMMQFQEHLMRSEYMDYVGKKVGDFEEHYAPMPSRCKGCDHCRRGINQYGGYCNRGNRGGYYKDDHDLNPTQHVPLSVYQQGTGLYRSKSDETLSVSSSHPSKRHWKMKSGKSRSIRDFKDKHSRSGESSGNKRGGFNNQNNNQYNYMVNNKGDYDGQGVRPAPQGEGGDGGTVGYVQQKNMYHEQIYGSVNNKQEQPQQQQQPISSGRSPEGQSSNNEYSEQSSYLDPVNHYGTWNRRRKPINSDLAQQLTDKEIMQQDFEKLTVRDYPQSSLTNGQQSTSTPVSQTTRQVTPQNVLLQQPQQLPQQLPISAQSTPEVVHPAPYNTPVYGTTPNYNTPNSSYNNTTHNSSSRLTPGSSYVVSPEQVQVHHTKTDSGSNPDSGYSSKYGMRPAVSGKSITTVQQNSPDVAGGGVVAAATQQQVVHHQVQIHQPPMQQQQQQQTGFYSQLPAHRGGMPMAPNYQQQQQQPNGRYDGGGASSPTKAVNRNRGYSSDGCPGMRRPKQDAYASDNCAGMRMTKSKSAHKSVLNDWYEQQVSSKGNGMIREVPSQQSVVAAVAGSAVNGGMHPHQSSQQLNGRPAKPLDFWPGKATQV